MNDSERQEWSRHYDTVHWTEISVFTGVIAVLLGLSMGSGTNFKPWFSVLGLWVTNLTIWLTASFRMRRRELAEKITDQEIKDFLAHKANATGIAKTFWPFLRLPMWHAFLLTFLFMDFLWLKPFWENRLNTVASILSSVTFLLWVVCGIQGRGPKSR